MPSQGGWVHIVREPRVLACVGLGESLWLPGSLAYRKTKSLSCVANESGSQRPRRVRRWLEPSLLNGALAERRGLDRFDIGIGPALPLEPDTFGLDIDIDVGPRNQPYLESSA